jgi:hypothetical protein
MNPRSITHGNGETERWTPDPNGMGRPCSILAIAGNASIVTSVTDPCGFVLSGSGYERPVPLRRLREHQEIGTITYEYSTPVALPWSSTKAIGRDVTRSRRQSVP